MQEIRHLLSLSALLLFSRSTLSSGKLNSTASRILQLEHSRAGLLTWGENTFHRWKSLRGDFAFTSSIWVFPFPPLLIVGASTVPLCVLLRSISTSAWREKSFSPKFPVHAFLEPHEFRVAAGSEFFSRCMRRDSFPFLMLRHQHSRTRCLLIFTLDAILAPQCFPENERGKVPLRDKSFLLALKRWGASESLVNYPSRATPLLVNIQHTAKALGSSDKEDGGMRESEKAIESFRPRWLSEMQFSAFLRAHRAPCRQWKASRKGTE